MKPKEWTIEGPLPVPAKHANVIHRIVSSELGTSYSAYIGADWWLAWLDGEPVGAAGMLTSGQEPESAYLNRCVVLPNARGLGIQGGLIKARLKEAKRRGFKWATSDTWWESVASANNLVKAGFRLYVPKEGAYRELGNVYFRRPL